MPSCRSWRVFYESELTAAPKIIVIHHTAVEKAEQLHDLEKAHATRGYHENNGTHVAYHWLIGTDGTVVHLRSHSDRSPHTRNQDVNLSSIAIALAGDFTHHLPSNEQLEALKSLIEEIRSDHGIEKVIGHREASATACPGTKLQDWIRREYGTGTYVSVSRYYTPVRGQEYYYRDSYEADFKVNCSGSCFHTASGRELNESMAGTVAACPKSYPFGTKIDIDGIGVVTCIDRGGAIISKEECRARGGDHCYDRIDLWMGVGTDAIDLIRSTVGGTRAAHIMQ